MIWACDADGRVTYLSPEWLGLTGLSFEEAQGWGWLEALYPEDRETVRETVLAASQEAAPFAVTFRLCRPKDDCLWVTGGAMPSFAPQNGAFLGFLGSVTEAPSATEAEGSVGYYRPQSPTALTRPHSALERIADYLLAARALAVEAGQEMLTGILDMALLETGQRLGAVAQREALAGLN